MSPNLLSPTRTLLIILLLALPNLVQADCMLTGGVWPSCDGALKFHGNAEPGSTLHIDILDITFYRTTVGKDGTWSFEMAPGRLWNGNFDCRITAWSENCGSQTLRVTGSVGVATINISNVTIQNGNSVIISGGASTLNKITASEGATVLATVNTNSGESYTLPAFTLSPGEHTIKVTSESHILCSVSTTVQVII